MRKVVLVLCFLIPGIVDAQEAPVSSYVTEMHQLNSKGLSRDFFLYVERPKELESEKSYPTIYLLDGGLAFPMLSGYYRYLRLNQSVPEAIIVGIAYPGESFADGNYRSTDFTAPAQTRDYWGGANEFLTVLEKEIMPFVEQNYPSDSNKRVLFGQSLGGQFVLYTALNNPKLFSGLIASNPALHRNLKDFLRPFALGDLRLLVSSGENDEARFRQPAIQWMEYAKQQKQRNLKTVSLVGQDHFSAAPESFRQGLVWWLGQESDRPDL